MIREYHNQIYGGPSRMSRVIAILALQFLVPAVVSITIVFLLRKFLSTETWSQCAAPFAVALGFFAGYALSPSLVKWNPTEFKYWQWLPYLGLLAAAMVLLGRLWMLFTPHSPLFRGALKVLPHLLVSLVAAWLLVPIWSDLQPSRGVLIGFLSGYLLLLTIFLELLPGRLRGKGFLGLLTLSSGTSAVLVTAFVSIMLGHLSALATAALGGYFLASFFFHNEAATSHSLIPVFAILAGGSAFVGAVYFTSYSLLLAPAAPLALWSFARGPLSRLRGWRAAVTQTVAVLIPLAIAIFTSTMTETAANY